MLDVAVHDKMNAFCQATYQLLADPDCDSSEEWSFVVAGGQPLTDDRLEQLCRSAVGTGTDIVYLEFGRQIQRGPQRVQIIAPHKGNCLVYSDCVFWGGDDGEPLKLIARRPHPSHFLVVGADLVQMPVAVAGARGPGINRATRKLREVARKCEGLLGLGTFVVQF